MSRNPELFTKHPYKKLEVISKRRGEGNLPREPAYSGFREGTAISIQFYHRDLNPPISLYDDKPLHRDPR